MHEAQIDKICYEHYFFAYVCVNQMINHAFIWKLDLTPCIQYNLKLWKNKKNMIKQHQPMTFYHIKKEYLTRKVNRNYSGSQLVDKELKETGGIYTDGSMF